ncbi:DUF1826 domain-containing protein [Methyloligella sp. 2.7D]|uniref:DUF1826 domain-containing protein n=1 Tax=unclassified Methyloligella TaxID=2625955 RepID=UPI00157C3A83|nr:DUF1826 domain-containing protein [Methyloligella sp. GL2]QKP76682.1 DUF1826 domain-containing protein [Methyloligella sp. GL2]
MLHHVEPVALAQSVAEGEAPEILDRIGSPGCAVAVWQRQHGAEFQQWIDGLSPNQLPEARLVLRPDRVEDAMVSLCADCGMDESSNRRLLTGDIAALAALFAQVMGAETVQLRLDVVSDNACRKFHLDNVPARLLCTYRGRGTEYGEARRGEEPRIIHELATGSVGLFRGRLWPTEQSGIVHRSPPISGLGETRLLLVLDPVTGAI